MNRKSKSSNRSESLTKTRNSSSMTFDSPIKYSHSFKDDFEMETDIDLDPESLFDTENEMTTKPSSKKSNNKGKNRPPKVQKNLVYESEKSQQMLEINKPYNAKFTAFKTRTLWTLILIFGFLIIISAGHVYSSLLVCGLIIAIYREIISLRRKREDHLKLSQYFFLRWYWFAVTVTAVGFPWLVKHYPRFDVIGTTLLNYHFLCTYLFAFFGLVWFILSLRQYTLRYQFTQLAIMLLTLFYVVLQSLMYIVNIYHGMIWFILPTSLVIINDVFAYLFGLFFGRTQLIKLSPRKTVEGYIGASVVTIISSVVLTWHLQKYKVMICPQEHINFLPFSMWWELDCIPNKSFLPIVFELPIFLKHFTHTSTITLTPIVLHSLSIGLFAAFCAPFGGFFASAFKRAIKIKDFGDSIPGHGGITDRFDCQILMGVFTYFYISTFVYYNPIHPTPSSILSDLHGLSTEDQLLIFYKLFEELKAKQALL